MKNWIKTRLIKLLTIVGWSSFTADTTRGISKPSSFRVTNYYYAYTFADGERKLIPAPKILANIIGGYGVCGWYIPFHEVKSIGFGNFKRRKFFIFHDRKSNWRRIKTEWKTLMFYYFHKQGKPQKYFQDKAIDDIMKSFKK